MPVPVAHVCSTLLAPTLSGVLALAPVTTTREALHVETSAPAQDEEGDLPSEVERASEAWAGTPNLETGTAWARALEVTGRYVEALAAWQQVASLEVLTPAQRAQVRVEVERMDGMARGRVLDDPASTERERIDRSREVEGPAPAPAPLNTAVPEEAPQADRVVDKWYFWVTLGVIVAAGATITGLAIQSATNPGGVDDRARTSPGASGGGPMPAATGLRF